MSADNLPEDRTDFTGRRYGKLTVTGYAGLTATAKQHTLWTCQCDCGSEPIVVPRYRLTNGWKVDCGCANKKESLRKKYWSEYQVWHGMKTRLKNPNSTSYARYGGRGIGMDPRWEDFAAFISDVGPRPSDQHSLDRIDNDKGYWKENCRWVESSVQAGNRSTTRLLTAHGKSLSQADWARELNVDPVTISNRIKKGYSLEEALTKLWREPNDTEKSKRRETTQLVPPTQPERIRSRVGEVSGKLTVTALAGVGKHGQAYWYCECSCGTKNFLASAQTLRTKTARSCGCLRKDTTKDSIQKTKKVEYEAWTNIKQRCLNPEHPNYGDYGGRGVTICEEWRNDFYAFYRYIGPRPDSNYSLDRIDNNRGYEPGNLRWALRADQQRNFRRNRIVEFRGQTGSVAELCERLNKPYETVMTRLKRGWSIEDAFATPIANQKEEK